MRENFIQLHVCFRLPNSRLSVLSFCGSMIISESNVLFYNLCSKVNCSVDPISPDYSHTNNIVMNSDLRWLTTSIKLLFKIASGFKSRLDWLKIILMSPLLKPFSPVHFFLYYPKPEDIVSPQSGSEASFIKKNSRIPNWLEMSLVVERCGGSCFFA